MTSFVKDSGATPASSGASGGADGGHTAVEIEFRNVVKRYPGQEAPAITDLSLTVPAGNICCLVGPSGGGKTTAMKLINRLINLTEGEILMGGESVMTRNVTKLRRDIGYVIQMVGLFPHMTIAGNIGVVPRLLGWPKARIKERVNDLLDLVELEHSYAKRYPAQLSGGQQQRIGLARALAVDPPVMLMDEPFGALDPITRSRLQDEFLKLQEQINKTVIFVTHDIDEAIKMGDRIAVLRGGGVLAQYGTADELLGSPADEYVADFVGADRGLKRLALRQIGMLLGEGASSQPAPSGAPTVTPDTSLRVGLSLLFTSGAQVLGVASDDGRSLGSITLDQLQAAVASDEGTVAVEGSAP
jgi:osmoprotectant transport system ATP-binding protein